MNHPMQSVSDIPPLIATSVVRDSEQDQTHGGGCIVDPASQSVQQVNDWNTTNNDGSGHSRDRGLRSSPLVFLFMLLLSVAAFADSLQAKAHAKAANDVKWQSYVFFSWYDGWGQHSVWGIGNLKASSNEGFAICGGRKISIVPSYDTHADLRAPMPFQSKEFAAAYNKEILRLLHLQNVRCTFEFLE